MNPKFHFLVLGSWLRLEFDTFKFSDAERWDPSCYTIPAMYERDFPDY